MPKPLLILSDAPTSGTGLGRITCDLATRIAVNMPDTFRIATAGYGGVVSRHLPFHQYILEGCQDFVCPTLPDVWRDWAGDESGILFTIWDISRLGWLLRPEMQCEIPVLREFLLKKPFKIWSYLPIDAEGPNGKLTFPLKENLKGADRLLAYGKWGAGVVDRTLDQTKGTCEFIPHGIDSSVFYERNRPMCRSRFASVTESFTITGDPVKLVREDEIIVGCVCTNQTRKNLHLAIESFSLIPSRKKRLWLKTDILERYWSIPALLLDYGVERNTYITLSDLSDEKMAEAYSACDITFAPGLGEGMGYPIHESLFCGTPCLHANYGGAPEWMGNSDLLIDAVAYYFEGLYACKRPVLSAQAWADRATILIGKRVNHNGNIDWFRLWKEQWEPWLRRKHDTKTK